MKKYKYILLTTIMLLFPCTTYAECTDEDFEYYDANKDQYTVTYKYDTNTKKYTLILDRKDPDRFDYIAHIGKDKKCEEITSNRAECYDIEPGTYKFEIVGQTKNCDATVESFELELTEYNKYYQDPLCEGLEEFYLCNPNYDKEIDYETFVERIEVYKKTKQREDEKQQEEKQKKTEEIINYIQENMITIIVVAVFTITLVITVILMAKSIKKSRRLE